ncbi:glutaredoxin family protein [Chlorobaculum sp. 24CR]|uniref:glutaredoxin family protein n=1 Tax=Chlorobaculum sp. 24CR TaxID=2508878 RepID=UPI00100C1AB2|nr:glutaredoxin family protein [Chlorobaculum sp. 24CR]RXK88705.1 glutaredoxin family protein [Chlorobaculum sp. 24CR]
MKPRVTIYGKPECCLCDAALEVLDEARRQIPFEIEKCDISGSADLVERYGLDIPVILVDGQVAFKHRIDKSRLVELLGEW